MATEQAEVEPEIGLDREKARKAHLQIDGHDVVSVEICAGGRDEEGRLLKNTAWVIVFNQNPDSPIVWQGQIQLDAPHPAGELDSDEILAFDRKVQEEGR